MCRYASRAGLSGLTRCVTAAPVDERHTDQLLVALAWALVDSDCQGQSENMPVGRTRRGVLPRCPSIQFGSDDTPNREDDDRLEDQQ